MKKLTNLFRPPSRNEIQQVRTDDPENIIPGSPEAVQKKRSDKLQPATFEPFSAAKNRIRRAHAAPDRLPSVLFFTTHKCASTFVTALLDELDAQSPYINMNYEGAYWELGDEVDPKSLSVDRFMMQHYDALFSQHGEIYGPLRRPIDFPGRDKFKHIFFFRDPRDVLVSMFFSFAYTHPEPINTAARETFLKRREQMQAEGIDAFVLRTAEENLIPRFVGYSELVRNQEAPLILRYDEFAAETETFLKKIADYLQIEIGSDSLARLTAFASPIRKGAPEMSHKRSGKSGQWKHELQPETAAELNKALKPTLDDWGF